MITLLILLFFFFFQAEDGIRDFHVTGVQTCALPILVHGGPGGQAQVGYFELTQALVNRGYVVFDINNRGSSGYGKTFFQMDDRKHGEADLGDVVACKKMLIDTSYVDP